MRGRKFQSQIFRAECRNFYEFSRLFSDSLNRILGTVFRQSGTRLRFGFDPEANVFWFWGVFWYHGNSMTNREGTRRCPVLYESEIWAILCVIVEKINNMVLYVKIMLIYTCLTY